MNRSQYVIPVTIEEFWIYEWLIFTDLVVGFERAAPALQFLPEIIRFEMILV